MRNKTLSFGFACICSFLNCIQANNYYVAPEASGDGNSWENASSLNDALLKATEADTIFAAPGTYTALPDSAFTCTERNNGVVVYGSCQQDAPLPMFNTLADTAFISSKLIGNGKSVIEIDNSTVKWVGFEITGGASEVGAGVYNIGGTLQCCIVHGNTAETNIKETGGGGIYNTGTITHCVVRGNKLITKQTTTGGAGICNAEGGLVEHSFIHQNQSDKNGGGIFSIQKAVVRDCEITDNKANGAGGGISMENSTISRTHLHGNSAAQQGTNGSGGGIYALADCLIDSCLIENNIGFSNIEAKRKGFGGGANITGESRIQNSIIRDNLCTIDEDLTDAHNGGGLYIKNGAEAINCLVVNNSTKGKPSASTRGGGIYCAEGGKVINCTVVGNYSSGRGGGIQLDNGTVANTIMWNNTNNDDIDKATLDMRVDGTSTVKNSLWSYYNKAAGLNSENNIEKQDPLFRNLANGNYRLTMESPAVNAGKADENPLTTDLAGEQRIAGGNIDLGAYELIYFLVNFPETVEGAELKAENNTAPKGENFSFSLIREAEYDESAPVVTTNRPEDGELDGGEGTDGTFNYTINNIQSDINITVTGLKLNPVHTVTLPETAEGLTILPEAEGNTVLGGQDYKFSLELNKDYDESTLEVSITREGTEAPETLIPNETGLYTIANIRSAVTIIINGLTLNPERTITLPSDIEGATLTPATAENKVRSGHSFEFSLALAENYNRSTPVVKISRAGANAETLTPDAGGKYLITEVRTDVTVEITGIVENPSKLGETGIDPMRIYTASHTLYIEADDATIDIHTLSGMKWTTAKVNGTTEFTLPDGIYIIRSNNQTAKVIVR